MSQVLFMTTLSMLVAWAIGAWVCRCAHVLGLVQVPNLRSSHAQPTPAGGGVGIAMAANLAGISLAVLQGWTLGWGVLGLAAVLAAVGLHDDIRHVPARIRLAVQTLVSVGLFVLLGELPPLHFPQPFGIEIAGWVLSALLLLTAIWWINLFNFMDGIDGIAAAQAVFMLLFGAMAIVLACPAAATDPVWVLMLCVAAAVLGFLLLNWPPARIFMGDVGSTWLGFMIFVLAVISVQKGWLTYAVWIILAGVFVTDATLTLFNRLARGEKWHEAHRDHAYQRLAHRWQGDRKVGHRSVTLLVSAINLLWIAPWAGACLLRPNWSLAFILAAYVPLVLAAWGLGAGRPKHD
ncbi:MraY family glycosyltransferase [Uliginosibacterium gangwonense]|uniref:MraY family glycosyltransferase n=1 Tax=Uliginosibacterium gangwonense TaxID=392736 RepID=UPI0003817509|nr:glycosyltransferase family 4 protein [Uliginosibacterium gangwonense]